MNILIRNLAEDVTEEKLIVKFRAFGAVTSASIVTDQATGLSRGFGFVEMPDDAEAKAAILALHHTKLHGLKIRVKEANPKYGPGYFSAQNELHTVAALPVQPPPSFRRAGKPPFKGRFTDRRGAEGRDSFRARFGRREGRPLQPSGGERQPGSRPSGERSDRPYSRFQKRDGGKPGYVPHGERGYGYRRPEERGGRPGTGATPRGEGRPAHPQGRPAGQFGGERQPGSRPSRERNDRSYSRFQKRGDGKPGYVPHGERGYGYRRPEERGGRPGTGFAPRVEGRPGYPLGRPTQPSAGERQHGPRRLGERSDRPYSRFPRRGGGKPGYAPHGARGHGYRRPEGKSGRFRPHGK